MVRTNTNWEIVELLSKKAKNINCKEHFKLAEEAMIEVAKVRKTRHNKYNINYHFVWLPKTRMRILTKPFNEWVEKSLRRVCAWNNWFPLAVQIMPDHVHFFVSAPPKWAPSKIVGSLKAWSSKDLREEYSTIRKTRILFDEDTGEEIDFKDFWARGIIRSSEL